MIVKKTDAKGNPLSGAEIGIYNANAELVTSGISDENGELIVYGLKPGSYYAKEIKAPEGYVLSDDNVYFIIDEYGIAQGSFLITNEAITVTVELPKTGSSNTLKTVCVSGTLLGFSSICLIYTLALRFKKKRIESI